jgi:molecular chaperone GrpE
VTGAVRQPSEPRTDLSAAQEAAGTGGDLVASELAALREQLAERTADVQRVQAEYANYRKRVDRDRDLVREQAVAGVLADLLGVLDDIDRARSHGELVGGFRSVAEQLEGQLAKAGLEAFAQAGEAFDPSVHEALTVTYSEDVDASEVGEVFQPGYRFAGRVIRPARVAVVEPGQPD